MKKVHKETEKILLEHEKKILDDLKKSFTRSLADVKSRIKTLMFDIEMLQKGDAGNETLIRSKIYQLNYQKALETQISGAMDTLNNMNTANIDSYLKAMYEDGYITQQYIINSFGIPVITPINIELMIAAVNTSIEGLKFSDRLYDDVLDLKRKTIQAITDGIATGKSYAHIASVISRFTEATMKQAWTIARTEGGRVSSTAKLQSQKDAKANGADIVKQWDATLDNKTRRSHRALDGQIREIDEPFEINGHKAQAPRMFGIASEDINCRCISLTIPRWDIEDNYTKRDGLIPESELKREWERQKASGTLDMDSPKGIVGELIEAKDYADWKKKYYGVIEDLEKR